VQSILALLMWLVVERRPLPARSDLIELMSNDPELGCVPITRIGPSAYVAVPAFPRRIGDRALVMLVAAIALDGSVVWLRFYRA